ncbi:cytochrome P450 [Mycobacterium sp. IDR2000157661]|uniref:cytochrome P450 n=1 Tax=Mycobacterium sp. IDR2000157661 TaxID=2867005 RepID=UPI001EECAA6A|nr:cytochrome P450 [Mycobacterium sp. IDR2000157661]ULE33121.1 cytochrome P450 [Mycobacterium sp. IDR2000157661]
MSDLESVDYFTDMSLVPDPYDYYDQLRSQCPVHTATPYGVMAVTGHQEALAAYKDPAMSSCVAVAGPFPPLPFTPEGDDISAQIEQHRAVIPMAEHIVTMDAEAHQKTRGLLSKLITPKRLSENEDFMWRLVDRQLDKIVDRGSCEFMEEFAKPLALLVIADLLGVPTEDHQEFKQMMGAEPLGEVDGNSGETVAHNPLAWLDEKFTSYISDRRRHPRADVLTELAAATYPDGSTPEVDEVVKLATFLFAAGTDTTTKLVSTAMRMLGERPDIQESLRGDRSRIPAFLEECLRMESPVKSHFRLARTSTTIGDHRVPAGTILMMLPGASNRDPRKFENPHEFRYDRSNVREHVAFGRGPHSCPGSPLARAEGRIAINRILDRMADIRISEAMHGPPESRKYDYEPTFIMRGLTALHVEYDALPDD